MEIPGTTRKPLAAWAQRFHVAAHSGDLSKLLPHVEPAAHFGIRAYQTAGQVTAEEVELVVLLRDRIGLSSVLAADGGETSQAALAASDPSVSTEALALSLLRRRVAAVHLRRRIARAARRSRYRRRRQRRGASVTRRSALGARS